MGKNRVPPQPTNAHLARWVARQVARWPFAWSSTVSDKERQISRLQDHLRYAEDALQVCRLDMEEIMRRISPPVVRANVSTYDNPVGMGLIITVRFNPVRMAIGARDLRRSHAMSGITEEIAHHSADLLAYEHSKQVRREILSNLAIILGQKEAI